MKRWLCIWILFEHRDAAPKSIILFGHMTNDCMMINTRVLGADLEQSMTKWPLQRHVLHHNTFCHFQVNISQRDWRTSPLLHVISCHDSSVIMIHKMESGSTRHPPAPCGRSGGDAARCQDQHNTGNLRPEIASMRQQK